MNPARSHACAKDASPKDLGGITSYGMKIIGIETSCDETAVAVIDAAPTQGRGEKIKVLSNVISSQIKLHAKYGGVVPNLAAREHAKNIGHVFKTALKQAGVSDFKKEIDLITITHGPGLGPALLVGLTFAKTLAWKYEKPLVGVNHMDGHIHSNWLNPIREIFNFRPPIYNIFPALNLIVSGGHTELVLMKDRGDYKIIGETQDDAVGEAFDKVARLLGLGYPGGPVVAQRATEFKSQISNLKIVFPRPMLHSKNYDFSYAGLKTSVLYKVRDLENAGIKISPSVINEICHAFQDAAIDVLIQKTIRAAREYDVKSILLSGGVSANKLLRERLAQATVELGVQYHQPAMEYTTDNAAMIAVAGYFQFIKNKKTSHWKSLDMNPNLTF